MIAADIALNLGVVMGIGTALYGVWSLIRSAYLTFRTRRDAGPLHAALEKMGRNVKARNARVSAKNIEDTF